MTGQASRGIPLLLFSVGGDVHILTWIERAHNEKKEPYNFGYDKDSQTNRRRARINHVASHDTKWYGSIHYSG
jgi:hypothetical protein